MLDYRSNSKVVDAGKNFAKFNPEWCEKIGTKEDPFKTKEESHFQAAFWKKYEN